MCRAIRHPLAPLAATAATITLLDLLLGASSFPVALAPVLLLLFNLLAGRLPGERLLERIVARLSPRTTPATPWRAAEPRAPRAHGPRGRALIPAGLAGRAPPPALT